MGNAHLLVTMTQMPPWTDSAIFFGCLLTFVGIMFLLARQRYTDK